MKISSLVLLSTSVTFSFLSACSVAPVRPYIEQFGQSVTSANSKIEQDFEADDLDSQIEMALRKQLASKEGLYELGACNPLEPLADFDNGPMKFEANCPKQPVVFDPNTGELVATDVGLAEDDPILQERNARKLSRALNSYAEALSDLVAANSKSETAAAASSALSAVGDFVDEASENKDPRRLFSKEGETLVSGLTNEALETYRYGLLKDVVTQADPWVQNAAAGVAAWLNSSADNERVTAAYEVLNEAVDAAQPGSAEDLESIDQAYEAAKKVEESASWRVYWEIGAAHKAIVESFEKPRDFDRLKDANERILDLVEAAKAFSEQ